MIVVLGLDLATRTGYAILNDKGKLLKADYMQLSVKSTHRQRFKHLHSFLVDLTDTYSPDFVVIEELHHSRNINTTRLLGGYLAVALLSIPEDVEVVPCHQGTAKKDIVKPYLGRASLNKEDVFNWAVAQYNLDDYTYDTNNDVTDAILMAHWGIGKLTLD